MALLGKGNGLSFPNKEEVSFENFDEGIVQLAEQNRDDVGLVLNLIPRQMS